MSYKRHLPSRRAVQGAVSRYAGRIQKLPPQRYRPLQYVGGDRYDIYDPPSALAWHH